MHADFDGDGAAHGEGEAADFDEEGTAKHGEQDEGGGGHAEEGEVVEDFAGVLQEEDQGKEHQGGEGGFAQRAVYFRCRRREEAAVEDAEEEGREEEDEVLDDEFADGEVDFHAGAVGDEADDRFHDGGEDQESDDAAAGGEGDGERHVAFGEHGEYVGGGTAGAASNEHEPHEVGGWEMQSPGEGESNGRQ